MDNNEYLDKGLYKVLIITDKDNLEKEFQIQQLFKRLCINFVIK